MTTSEWKKDSSAIFLSFGESQPSAEGFSPDDECRNFEGCLIQMTMKVY